MFCDECTNLKRDLQGLKSRIDEELSRFNTTAAIEGFGPLFAVIRDYHAQRANYERHRIEVATSQVHAHV
jgi:hypothetical protein